MTSQIDDMPENVKKDLTNLLVNMEMREADRKSQREFMNYYNINKLGDKYLSEETQPYIERANAILKKHNKKAIK